MSLPNLSYMMSVGELRYIQSKFEKGADRNPDSAVWAFLPLSKRVRCLLRGTVFISRVRSNPFYYYLDARTKYYDQVFLDAIRASFRCVINLGCGSDTRSYRFERLLKEKNMTVLECDQAQAIQAKEEIARKNWTTDHVRYMSIDLDQGDWSKFLPPLIEKNQGPILVMLEGVSPYVGEDSFKDFLKLLASHLHSASQVAYDFKLRGAADDFGGSQQAQRRFRLPGDAQEVADYHRGLGFDVRSMELSDELTRRLQPGAKTSFKEDGLVRLTLRSANR